MGLRDKLRDARMRYLTTPGGGKTPGRQGEITAAAAAAAAAGSEVHKTFATIRFATSALADWRSATLMLLKSANSDALSRAQVRRCVTHRCVTRRCVTRRCVTRPAVA